MWIRRNKNRNFCVTDRTWPYLFVKTDHIKWKKMSPKHVSVQVYSRSIQAKKHSCYIYHLKLWFSARAGFKFPLFWISKPTQISSNDPKVKMTLTCICFACSTTLSLKFHQCNNEWMTMCPCMKQALVELLFKCVFIYIYFQGFIS